MLRTTIDYGIDLGTTNSAIAVLNEDNPVVFKSNEGMEYISSAVWIDHKDRIWVGRQAKEKLIKDENNAFSKFKLFMGTEKKYHFKRSGREMTPEELSAEVLKELKGIVLQKTNENVDSAVIAVPAAFEIPQTNATEKAANLAGIKQIRLVQEPVAAALAYGFRKDMSKSIFLLVFDFGGGTFDAAIIRIGEGTMGVVDHEGNKDLGGGLIDERIVDEVLMPEVLKRYNLKDFHAGNERWVQARQTLFSLAEEAKILLSRKEVVEIWTDYLCLDDNGNPVEFEYEMTRKEVEKLAEPYILRAINLSKKVLSENNLTPDDLEKILLVGGVTLMPYLRERILDKNSGLGRRVEFSEDPMTVVVRGAAIFAGTQKLDADISDLKEDEFAIELEYQPMGPETEFPIAGKVLDNEQKDWSGYTIEFINDSAKPPWRSGKIGLNPQGSFITTLWAEKGHKNIYNIDFCTPDGKRLKTVPSKVTRIVSLAISNPPLIHSIGIETINEKMSWFFEKGTPLPARKRNLYTTVRDIAKGVKDDVIYIPVLEGESRRPYRNRKIGVLRITGDEIKRDVPFNSEVEVTIDIDESRLIRVKAYIPILNEEYEHVIKLGYDKYSIQELEEEFDNSKKRLEDLRQKVKELRLSEAQRVLERIDQERLVQEIERLLSVTFEESGEGIRIKNRIDELQLALDEIEDIINWPSLVKVVNDIISEVRGIVQYYGNNEDKDVLLSLEKDLNSAIQSGDTDLLVEKGNDLRSFGIMILDRVGLWQPHIFQELQGLRSKMKDQDIAEKLFEEGQRALERNDDKVLRDVNLKLIALLPYEYKETPDLRPKYWRER